MSEWPIEQLRNAPAHGSKLAVIWTAAYGSEHSRGEMYACPWGLFLGMALFRSLLEWSIAACLTRARISRVGVGERIRLEVPIRQKITTNFYKRERKRAEEKNMNLYQIELLWIQAFLYNKRVRFGISAFFNLKRILDWATYIVFSTINSRSQQGNL